LSISLSKSHSGGKVRAHLKQKLKKILFTFCLELQLIEGAAIAQAWAQERLQTGVQDNFQVPPHVPAQAKVQTTELAQIPIETNPQQITSAYGQLLTLQVQSFHPTSLQVSNGTYAFNYIDSKSNTLSTILFEMGWAPKLFDFFGSFYVEELLNFAPFHGGTAVVSDLPALSYSTYSLFIIGLSTRIMYAATWLPWKLLIPFLDVGYQYSIFYQTGSSGLESAQGGVSNTVGALGLRFWLNQTEPFKNSPPLFLILRLNQIFSNPGSVNLESTSLSGGLSLGL